MNIDCIFRVCIIGDAGSGKTSINNKYVYDIVYYFKYTKH